jgi:hypothetical protein
VYSTSTPTAGILGDEVGLGVELDQRPALGRDQTFGGSPLGALADVLGTLDAKRLDSFVEIAVGLGKCVLAVHHSRAGELAEPLDVGGGEVSHVSLPQRRRWW